MYFCHVPAEKCKGTCTLHKSSAIARRLLFLEEQIAWTQKFEAALGGILQAMHDWPIPLTASSSTALQMPQTWEPSS